MKKKFAFNLVLLVVLNLLIKPFWIFGIDRTVQNITGPGEYGLYFSLFNFSLLLNILLDLGLTNYNNRAVSQNQNSISNLFANIVGLKFILSVFYAVTTIILGIAFGYNSNQFYILYFLIFNQFIISFTQFLRSNISGLQHFAIDSFLSVIDKFLMILFCSIAIWFYNPANQISIKQFVHLQTAAYVLSAIIILMIVFFKSEKIQYAIHFGSFKNILKDSFPFAFYIFLMSIYMRLDSVLLERLLPDGNVQSGIYAQSFRLLDAITMFSFLFPTLLFPMFSKLIASNQSPKGLAQFSFSILFVFSIAFVFSCIIGAIPIMNLLYDHNNANSITIFKMLIISFIPSTIVTIYGTLLTANGNLRQLNILSFFAVCISLIINFLIIPHYQALGAAITSLVVQTIVAIGIIYISNKKFNQLLPSNDIFRYALFIIGSIFVTFLISFINIHFTILFAINSFTIIALSFLLKIVSISDIFKQISEIIINKK